MNGKNFKVSLSKNPDIVMNVIPGHFTTNHFHLSHYLDLDNFKTSSSLAHDVAIEFLVPYGSTTLIDTIVCMEGTELIGAYLAEELVKEGIGMVNSGNDIFVVKPISNVHRQLTFQSNLQKLITDHNILLLVSSISSGITLKASLEMLAYYGGNLVGISALFNSYPKNLDRLDTEVNYLFTASDIPNYKMYEPSNCELCISGRKLDAIIIQGGYTEI